MSAEDHDLESCDRCHGRVGEAERALGWPIYVGEDLICPACYGDEAYCAAEGHVLPATTDSGECDECDSRREEQQFAAEGLCGLCRADRDAERERDGLPPVSTW